MSSPTPPVAAVGSSEPAAAHAPWARSVDEVAAALGADVVAGLTGATVQDRVRRDGRNELPSPPRPSELVRFLAQFRSWLVAVLLGAAGLALLVGEPVDAAVVAGVLLLNTTLGYLQERRAERSIAALEQLLATRAKVRRDGRLVEVAASELVVGDLVALDAGDRVPADGRLVSASALSIDESSLTGESVPVDKDAAATCDARAPLGDRSSMVWMNTTVTRGRAWLLVTATGRVTEVGRIATLLAEAAPRPTPLQRQLDVLGRRLVTVASGAVALVFAVALVRGEPLLDAALDAIALAIAAIPEGLPAVVTLTLALGGAAMARHQAIVRRPTSVETLGSTTVIATDKTGTLTRNRMVVTVLWWAGREHGVTDHGDASATVVLPAGEEFGRLVGAMVRCNDAEMADGRPVGDPTEGAVLVLATRLGADVDALRRPARVGEVPFDASAKLMAVSHVDGDGRLVVEVTGAPDVLLARCDTWIGPDGPSPLDPASRAMIRAAIGDLAGRGLRTLGIATRQVSVRPGQDPAGRPLASRLRRLTFEGMVGIVDPPRPGVAEAIATARRAGIRIMMVTGDHPSTAAAIARSLGIGGEVVSGRDLDGWDDGELAARIHRIGVCARVAPGHKVRIVRALQARGEIAAMTGDGVNDAPALEHADIGVAMGIAGTEVTKQAADLVLADDDFTTIVRAVERGRTIYDNIVAFIRFQLTTNIGAIATILLARLAGLPNPFTPIQLLWVNLIMDGPPALALGVDPARQDAMQRPPRHGGSQLLDVSRLSRVTLTGLAMAAGTLGVYGWALRSGLAQVVAATWAFTTFVLLQVGNALEARCEHGTVFSRHTLTNRHLWLALAGVVALQVGIVHLPVVGRVLDTVALTPAQWAVAAAVASSVVVVEELRKLAGRRPVLPGRVRGTQPRSGSDDRV